MTNKELAQTFKTLYKDYKVHYVKGGCLQKATPENKQTALKRFDNGTVRRARIENADESSFFGDCVCSIKSVVFWDFEFDKGGHAGPANTDFTTEQMIERCSFKSDDFKGCTVGELLWKPGHCGVVVEILPDGRAIGAEVNERWGKEGLMLTAVNCQIDGLDTQEWSEHGRIPEIDYVEPTLLELSECVSLRRGDKGPRVKALQQALIDRGFDVGPDGADGDYGQNTEAGVDAFQNVLYWAGAPVEPTGTADYMTQSYLIRRI